MADIRACLHPQQDFTTELPAPCHTARKGRPTSRHQSWTSEDYSCPGLVESNPLRASNPHTARREALTPCRRGNARPSARGLHGYLTPNHGTPTPVHYSESGIWDSCPLTATRPCQASETLHSLVDRHRSLQPRAIYASPIPRGLIAESKPSGVSI